MTVVTCVVKDEEKTLKKKHLVYEPFCVTSDDPTLDRLAKESLKEFVGEPTDVYFNIKFTP